MSTTPTTTPRLIRQPEVQHQTGLGKSQLYSLIRQGRFPAPVKLSERCSAWNEIAVHDWIADRLAAQPERAAA